MKYFLIFIGIFGAAMSAGSLETTPLIPLFIALAGWAAMQD